MKRLLFVLCSLFAVQEVCARRPAVRFDLPYTVEHGKYVVVLGTPAGSRRFIFDTGASGTCISESLRCELGAETVKTRKVRDFEGHVVPIDLVRLDSLRMGDVLFRDHPDVLARYQLQFRYILVDEYQDTNTSQYELVKLLVGSRARFTVVGDDDQSIYSWRGARPQNLVLLSQDFPALKVIKLEQNYRSSGRILKAANILIANNPHVR